MAEGEHWGLHAGATTGFMPTRDRLKRNKKARKAIRTNHFLLQRKFIFSLFSIFVFWDVFVFALLSEGF
jgi:hypothetical protein